MANLTGWKGKLRPQPKHLAMLFRYDRIPVKQLSNCRLSLDSRNYHLPLGALRAGTVFALTDVGRALMPSEQARARSADRKRVPRQDGESKHSRNVERQSLHRVHRPAFEDIAVLIQHVVQLAPELTGRPSSAHTVPWNRMMRLARIRCDHLAGRLGVAITVVSDWLTTLTCLLRVGSYRRRGMNMALGM